MDTSVFNLKVRSMYRSLDDVWIHSNTATNGGYDVTGGGVINTNALCGGGELASELGLSIGGFRYDTSSTDLTSQMGPALAAAVDADTQDANDAWLAYYNRVGKPEYNEKPQWAIVPWGVVNGSLDSNVLPSNELGSGGIVDLSEHVAVDSSIHANECR